jgi:type VI secretion system secreted protein Hcp
MRETAGDNFSSMAIRPLLQPSPVKAIKSFILNPRQRWKRLGAVFCVALIYVAPLLTIPGMAAIYMKMEGVKGEVRTEGHEDWIELSSVQMGLGRAIASPVGGKRDASLPSFSDVTITKSTDISTPPLFLESVMGKAGKQVDLHFTRSIDGQEVVYYTITLSDVLVSSFSQSSGGDRPTESLSLNFTKFNMIYTPVDVKGGTGTPLPATYDLTTGKGF